MNWWEVHGWLRGFEGDTSFIFDCYSGRSWALGDFNGDEMMAVSDWDETPSSSFSWSFTQAFIDTLWDLNGTPATLAQIYAIVSPVAQRNQVESCPIHVLRRNKPRVSIGRLGTKGVLGGSTSKFSEAVVVMRARL